MKSAFIRAGIVAMTSLSSAQQATPQYVISTHIMAGNPLQAGAVETLAWPTFRVPAAHFATMDLGDATDGLRLAITASDLGSGKVGLRVAAETRHGVRRQASTFDLLTGGPAPQATCSSRHKATRLPKDSVANVSQIITLDRSVLTERMSRLGPKLLAQILHGVDVVLGR